MIKEIRITNFYSFSKSQVILQPDTNILIGINGSGKSNFLKAVKLLKEGVAGIGLKKHLLDNLGGFDNIFFKGTNQENNSNSFCLEYIIDGKTISEDNHGFKFTDDLIYKITIIKSPSLQNYYVQEVIKNTKGFIYLEFNNGIGILNERVDPSDNKLKLIKYSDYDSQELVLKEVSDVDRYFALTTLKKAIREIMVYDYFDTTPKSPIRKPMLSSSERRLLSDGVNLPQILNTIKINYKQQYKKIQEMLSEVNQNFTGFDFNIIGGNIELMLEEQGLGSSVHVSNISDGTLRYLCLLSILYNPDRGRFICIDEPEVGLHPDMILNIANAIKEASEDSTLVISTHSENLLNYFNIENVRIFEKNEDNSTKVVRFNEKDFSSWYADYSLGQLWKQGYLGGVRYGN